MAKNLTAAPFDALAAFEGAQRMAKALTSSTLVPQQYQGDQNMGNALIALEMAQRTGASVLAVMQNLYVVHGKPAWSAQYLISAFNACGRFDPIQYIEQGGRDGDDWGFIAKSMIRGTDKVIAGPLVTIGMAKAEGWYSKKGSKWQTMPELMLRYRAATFLVRQTAPELTMGMQTAEELDDVIDVTPLKAADEGLGAALDAGALPLSDAEETPQSEPEGAGMEDFLTEYAEARDGS